MCFVATLWLFSSVPNNCNKNALFETDPGLDHIGHATLNKKTSAGWDFNSHEISSLPPPPKSPFFQIDLRVTFGQVYLQTNLSGSHVTCRCRAAMRAKPATGAEREPRRSACELSSLRNSSKDLRPNSRGNSTWSAQKGESVKSDALRLQEENNSLLNV